MTSLITFLPHHPVLKVVIFKCFCHLDIFLGRQLSIALKVSVTFQRSFLIALKKGINQSFFRMVEGESLDICPKVNLRYNFFELGPSGLLRLIASKSEQTFFVKFKISLSDCCKSISKEEHKSPSALTDSCTYPVLPLVGPLFDWQ